MVAASIIFFKLHTHSRLIVGYWLHPENSGLIHHSDRGSQYCILQYLSILREASSRISMTENGDPYENAIAESGNGILKADFRLNRTFKSQAEAVAAPDAVVHN